MSVQCIVFVPGMLEWEQLLRLEIESSISHLLSKCSNFILFILRQGFTKLFKEALSLDPSPLSS